MPILNSSGLHPYPALFPLPPGKPIFFFLMVALICIITWILNYNHHFHINNLNPSYVPHPLSASASTTEPNIFSTSNITNTSTSFINHKLHIITKPAEFNDWISNFGEYLHENDMGYFIPLSEDTVGDLSPKDKDFLITIFNTFVQSFTYPTWFMEHIRQPYLTLDQFIQLALLEHDKAKKIDHYLHELINIKFAIKYWHCYFPFPHENFTGKI